MKEVEALQKEIDKLKKSIAELEAKQEKTYHYWSELPKWAYNPLKALYDGGYFAGASASDLNISHTKLEMLVILARTLKNFNKLSY